MSLYQRALAGVALAIVVGGVGRVGAFVYDDLGRRQCERLGHVWGPLEPDGWLNSCWVVPSTPPPPVG